MRASVNALLLLLAQATDKALARDVQFLKVENQILRSKLPRVVKVTPQERRRLVKFGRPLGSALKQLISIASPRTFLRWLDADGRERSRRASPTRPSRPRTAEAIRELVLRLARENDWGYTRILGELKKLGVRKICRSTVVNSLREAGLDPGPKRGEDTWDDFITHHAATLWSCDFFTKQVSSLRGLVEVYVLFFLNVQTRRVYIAGLTPHPDRAWVAQQARNTAMFFAEQEVKPAVLLRDNDGKFDAVFAAEGVAVKRITPASPNLNARAERWVQTVKRELLDRFVVFGETHLCYLLSEFLSHYHQNRPHQALGNAPPCESPSPVDAPSPDQPRRSAKKGAADCSSTIAAGRRDRVLHTAEGHMSRRQ
jgi:putative transposase